jgi:signal peptidase II
LQKGKTLQYLKALHIRDKYWLLLRVAALIVIIDQFSKIFIVSMVPVYKSITIIPGFFELTHIYNSGGAFGILADNKTTFVRLIIPVVAILSICIIFYLYLKAPHGATKYLTGLSLILGGTVGNVIDRIRLRSVVDYLDFCIRNIHWPAFNFADIAIVTGVLISLYQIYSLGVQKATMS